MIAGTRTPRGLTPLQSGTTNVAAHFLAKDGTNLAGQPVPLHPSATYPGETGSATVALAPRNTRIVPFLMGSLSDASGKRANSNAMLASVIVTSDQLVVVGLQVAGGVQDMVNCGRASK